MSGDGSLAEWIRDWRLAECEHYVSSIDRELCCAPCLRDRILASDWLATQIAAAEQRGWNDRRSEYAALEQGYNAQVQHGRAHWVRAEKAEAALADLRAKVEAAVLVAEAKYGIQSSPVAQLRDLLDGA